MALKETRAEQIAALVKTQLESIEEGQATAKGWTYWLTPKKVLRLDGSTEKIIKGGFDVVYTVIPDFDEQNLVTSFEIYDKTIRYDLDLFARYKPKSGAELDPWSNQDDPRDQLRSRMAGDVEACLRDVDPGTAYQGLEVYRVWVERIERAAEITHVPGWARVIMRVAISYRSRPGAP